MQELSNDNYSEIKLYSTFHIEYKAIEFSTNKKEPTITFPIPILERLYSSAAILNILIRSSNSQEALLSVKGSSDDSATSFPCSEKIIRSAKL